MCKNFHKFDVEISSIFDIKVMKVFANCTQLLLLYYVQPDDGHHKGRNM